jgi:hypothetical protein
MQLHDSNVTLPWLREAIALTTFRGGSSSPVSHRCQARAGFRPPTPAAWAAAARVSF